MVSTAKGNVVGVEPITLGECAAGAVHCLQVKNIRWIHMCAKKSNSNLSNPQFVTRNKTEA